MPISDRIRLATRRVGSATKEPGTPPGTLVYEGEVPPEPVRFQVYDFDQDGLVELEGDEISTLGQYRDSTSTTWINVDGVHDAPVVDEIGRQFNIHPLTLEDIMSPDQRPKVEEYPGYTYVVLQMMHYDDDRIELRPEQVSIVVMSGVILSFQEGIVGDAFDPVRQRLRESGGRIRGGGADYLLYTLVDVIVDYYMYILEAIGDHIDELEDAVLADPSPAIIRRISHLRRMVTLIRKAVWPLRDAVLALERSERSYMSKAHAIYFRDVYDHAVRTIEIIESAREVLATVTDLHVSTLSYRMNEIMKVLAIIATFFLPLTFIAGVYGMNFDPDASPLNMPELTWYYGYPFSLVLMLAVAAGMFIYFRRKEWL